MTSTPPTQRGPLRRFLRKAIGNWLERHRLPFNFWIHMIGIPMATIGLFLLLAAPFGVISWYWGVAGLVVGYLLQWIGHLAEGNDLGEWAGIKRLLGMPYVSISPRWQKSSENG
jgi:hypothetical protein